jgi:hypothetical protein
MQLIQGTPNHLQFRRGARQGGGQSGTARECWEKAKINCEPRGAAQVLHSLNRAERDRNKTLVFSPYIRYYA